MRKLITTPDGLPFDKEGIAKLNLGENATAGELKIEETRLVQECEAQEYARKREAEFPSIKDLVVALYDTDDKSAVEAKRASVKAKYPKP